MSGREGRASNALKFFCNWMLGSAPAALPMYSIDKPSIRHSAEGSSAMDSRKTAPPATASNLPALIAADSQLHMSPLPLDTLAGNRSYRPGNR